MYAYMSLFHHYNNLSKKILGPFYKCRNWGWMSCSESHSKPWSNSVYNIYGQSLCLTKTSLFGQWCSEGQVGSIGISCTLGFSHSLSLYRPVGISLRELPEEDLNPKGGISLGHLQSEQLLDTKGSRISEIQLGVRDTAGTTCDVPRWK